MAQCADKGTRESLTDKRKSTQKRQELCIAHPKITTKWGKCPEATSSECDVSNARCPINTHDKKNPTIWAGTGGKGCETISHFRRKRREKKREQAKTSSRKTKGKKEDALSCQQALTAKQSCYVAILLAPRKPKPSLSVTRGWKNERRKITHPDHLPTISHPFPTQTRPEASTRCHTVSLRWPGISLRGPIELHSFHVFFFSFLFSFSLLFFLSSVHFSSGKGRVMTTKEVSGRNTPVLSLGPWSKPKAGERCESHNTEQKWAHKCCKKSRGQESAGEQREQGAPNKQHKLPGLSAHCGNAR